MFELESKSWSFWGVWVVRVLVAGLFVFSAVAKWGTSGGFEVYLVNQGLFETRWMAGVFTRVLIGVEFALGVSFLQPYYMKTVVAPLITLMLTVFTVYLGYAWYVLDLTGNCGCFGEVVAMGPLESIAKNVLTLAMVVGIWKWLPDRSGRWYVPGGVLVGSLLLVFFTLPLTAKADHPFGSFTRFEGAGSVDLLRGEKVVVVADVECPHCQKATRQLGEMKRSDLDLPEIYYLVYGTKRQEEVEQFWTKTKARFPYRIIKRNVFMRLLKKQLPTVYLLRNGEVQAVWDEDPVEKIRRMSSS